MVKFFCLNIPVLGSAPIVPLKDGDCRFWKVVTQKIVGGTPMCFVCRENIGKWTLQDRIEGLAKESSLDLSALAKIDHIEPASTDDVALWLRTHTWVPTLKEAA